MRCDGGPKIGIGHVVRSLALAEEALDRGHRVTFAGTFEGPLLKRMLTRLPVEIDDAWTGMRALSPDEAERVLHLDTYESLPTQSGQRSWLLSSMEDGPFGRRPTDLAIDPNLGSENERADGGPARIRLAGTAFVPLRKSVTNRRGRWTPRDRADSVMLLMGGTDPGEHTPRVLAALAAVGRRMHVLVVAPDRLLSACADAARNAPILDVQLVTDVEDTADLMVEQDLVVSASGTSVWELSCLGVPMALLCAAENQRRGYERMIASGAAIGLGVAGLAPTAVNDLRHLLDDPASRAALSKHAGNLVDGRGAWRVVGAWEQMVSERPLSEVLTALEMRPASVRDAEQLWLWRNDPETRAGSRSTTPVPFDDHLHWLDALLSRRDRLLLIAADDRGDVGTVRWDQKRDRAWEVSITVSPDRRGEGLAAPLLRSGEIELVRRAGSPTLSLATVRVDNRISRRLFVRAGYVLDAPADADGFETFRKQLPAASLDEG